MKKFFSKGRKIKIGLLAAGILIVLAVVFLSFNKKEVLNYETAKVEKHDLVQTVKEVGAVKSAEEIKLSFPFSGKLANKFVNLGDAVLKEQVIAELDYSAVLIEKINAESNLSAARAGLNKLLAGASKNEISVVEAQVSQAQKAYDAAADNLNKINKTVAEEIRQAEKNLEDLVDGGDSTITTYEASLISAETGLQNARATYQKAIDNAVETGLVDAGAKLSVGNTALDNVDRMLSDDDIKDTLSAKNKNYLNNVRLGHSEAEELYLTAVDSLNNVLVNKEKATVKKALDDVLAFLKKTSYVLDNSYVALEYSTMEQASLDYYKNIISTQITYNNSAISIIQVDQQSLDSAYLSYDTSISTAQNSLNQAQASFDNALLLAQNNLSSVRLSGESRLASADSSVKTSKEALEVARRQLNQLKSPARSEDVALSQANVDQAQAALDLISRKIDDSLLKSPINGKLVRSVYEIGEQVPAGQTAFAVLKENSFEIEVDISESDIAKIEVGNSAEITLDAFGDERKIKGSVMFIEPAETVIQEVVYYKVKVSFSEDNDSKTMSQVKSGMTANVKIYTGSRNDVLAIPERAVIEKLGKKIVRILRGGSLVEATAETGLRGDDGLIELISGAKEGDEIVVYIKNSK